MNKNIGIIDRLFRFFIGLILVAYGWWQNNWTAFLLALFVFYEVFASWCAFYALLGKNSCPLKTSKIMKTGQLDSKSRRLDAHRLGLIGGTIVGICLLILNLFVSYFEQTVQWPKFFDRLFSAFRMSWEGSLIAFINGFVVGFFTFLLIGSVYNALNNKRKI